MKEPEIKCTFSKAQGRGDDDMPVSINGSEGIATQAQGTKSLEQREPLYVDLSTVLRYNRESPMMDANLFHQATSRAVRVPVTEHNGQRALE